MTDSIPFSFDIAYLASFPANTQRLAVSIHIISDFCEESKLNKRGLVHFMNEIPEFMLYTGLMARAITVLKCFPSIAFRVIRYQIQYSIEKDLRGGNE